MKHLKLFCLPFLLLIFCQNILSQMVTVNGQLITSEGEPLIGVSVVIKGTTTGTISDIDGNYTLEAPLDGTLVFSFVGMVSEEVAVASLVSESSGKQPTRKAPRSREKVEKSNLSKTDSIFYVNSIYDMEDSPELNLRILRKYDPHTYYRVIKGKRKSIFTKLQVSFKSTLAVDEVSKLPAFQNQYSQGRNVFGELTWQGPDQNEIFSWGPSLQTLEYTDLPYAYDKNGSIVYRGLGNGNPVNIYDPTKFFQNGISNRQSLALMLNSEKTNLRMTYHYTSENGIIPTSGLKKNNFQFHFKTHSIRRLEIDMKAMASLSDANLLSGFSQSHIMQSVFQTPITFDNTNAMPPSMAVNDRSSYTLPDGEPRSYAPDQINNPYWLINNTTDHEKSKCILGGIDLKYDILHWLSATMSGSLESQNSIDNFGFNEGKSGFPQSILSKRSTELLSSYARAGFKVYRSFMNWELDGDIYYELVDLNRQLSRSDISLGETDLETRNLRTVQSIVPHLKLSYIDIIIGDFGFRAISSSTLSESYIKPTIALGFVPTHIRYCNFGDIDYLKLFGSYTTGINEVPLGFKRGAFNSTLFSSDEYSRYYEYEEINYSGSLGPELTDRWEIGTDLRLFYNRLTTEFSFYESNTKQVLTPIYDGEQFIVENGCDIHSIGYDLKVSSYNRFWWGTSMQLSFSLSANKTKVTKVYHPSKQIIIGGFSDVSVALIEGQPYGVILGNSYLYNENDQLIIDEDGFPAVNNNLQIIGNPHPDWIMGWDCKITHGGWDFAFTIDIKKGGDIWNGTKNKLNYLGLTKESGEQRGIGLYIFEGVHSDGSPNHTPVSFYDPSLPIEENRWVRYGPSGVAVEAIEDGSWFRLSELKVSYSLPTRISDQIKFELIRFSVFANNSFVITKYSGVDPETKVLGFENNYGLDYFNAPDSRTFGASIELIF